MSLLKPLPGFTSGSVTPGPSTGATQLAKQTPAEEQQIVEAGTQLAVPEKMKPTVVEPEKKDLEFNEFIELSSDNQFVKRRVYPDSTSFATGSYTLIQSEDSEYYEFVYEEESYLIQNCGSSLKEHISILNNKEIFIGGYLPCDGPGFGYRLAN